MIRMAFMTDKANVIGASTPEANKARFPLLPKQLPQAMGELYQTENIAVGAPSLGQMIQVKKNRYAITRDADYQPPEGLKDTIIVTDYMQLVNQYKDSDEELLIAGGATIFKLFCPMPPALTRLSATSWCRVTYSLKAGTAMSLKSPVQSSGKASPRIITLERGKKMSTLEKFPEYLLKGDAASVIGLFGQEPIVNCQRTGEISGEEAVATWVGETSAWLKGLNTRIEHVVNISNYYYVVSEFILWLTVDGKEVDLPYVVMANKAGEGSIKRLRTYHSTWP